ncbi:MAG TPA: S-layer homology domain-containing protein [Chloroflexia bacterium]|nr:S-layer homology domain-containing protein [Chloroflexia bacterium]
MAGMIDRANLHVLRGAAAGLTALLTLALLSTGARGAGPGSASRGASGSPPHAAPQTTPDFQDVDTINPFYPYLHNLYGAGVVGGYGCGGAGEPCVPPANLPYYRPGNAVTRLQMTKFIDLGRRNIADATGNSLAVNSLTVNSIASLANASASSLTVSGPVSLANASANSLTVSGTTSLANASANSLVISATTSNPLNVLSNSGASAVYAQCRTAGDDCFALFGTAPAGDYAANLQGGRGVYSLATDAGYPAVAAEAYGATAYGVSMYSGNYRGGYAKSGSTTQNDLYVDTVNGPSQATAALEVNGSIRGEGNLYIAGSKAGYVVDIMQNVDATALAPGDVVVIAGSSAPVLGQIPVVTVRKATTADDTGVAGVVDQAMYVPDAATKAAYDAQEAAIRSAMDRRAHAPAAAAGNEGPPAVALPAATISDEQGTLHALPAATSVPPGGYCSVVTLGSYKAVKVDARFGAIHVGDLLTSSPHAGYAMKVTDKLAALGAVIGKALADLATGTGTISILVTLK